MTGPTPSPASLKPKIGLTGQQVIELAIRGLQGDRPAATLALLEEWAKEVQAAAKKLDEAVDRCERSLANADVSENGPEGVENEGG